MEISRALFLVPYYRSEIREYTITRVMILSTIMIGLRESDDLDLVDDFADYSIAVTLVSTDVALKTFSM